MKKKSIYEGEVGVEFELGTGNLRFLLKKVELYLSVSQNKILIQNANNLESFKSNKFSFLVQLLKILPHTPVSAIGYNIHLNIPKIKRDTLTDLMKENFIKLKVNDKTIQSQFLYQIRKDYLITINYQLSDQSPELVHFNFEDRAIPNSELGHQSVQKFISKIEEFNKYASSHLE
ncbi:hypothetical protein MKU65_06240 [Leptospira interrogans]|nr:MULTISPECIES: hypothetical protein [Leptospira]MCH1885877.1 hypothetical protein [Leptospira interrogans]MCH1892120.1 hypothetical protein [Leptospira interrogans]MCH1898951.1 hypothetical protein [Leptospira interrogans]MCH1902313.1 hypothetical protein [Leptospira interrogans]MCL8267163.1 hypothetical protein [Leptospira weilii]